MKNRDLQNGAFIGNVHDENGNFKALKVYKNDKEVYTNPDFAAKQLGLKKEQR